MTYKIRSTDDRRDGSGKPYTSYSLTVPGDIASVVSDSVRFTCEVSESGILFRPAERAPRSALPDWALSPRAGIEIDSPEDDPRGAVDGVHRRMTGVRCACQPIVRNLGPRPTLDMCLTGTDDRSGRPVLDDRR